ncbi:hypothetical protein M3P05_02955 [Sansalvadorimonas sp. 2012CJ34-2]|uniref:Uncharacterized protein n=1 Tax=Parendozoicomonas callyspongiae TaxID=2942213 RepID=A0ABT0PC01_9GAMM|nr:hypothetical protein [Sansalvadorimonas sp. 2012CJ34-2]MCL6268910.1 hypothetical protein [Sansalvadorimonas sp. 2012CJ34-2]
MRIGLPPGQTLADRLAPLYPGTPSTQGGDSPPSRAPVMALFDIPLDEDMTEEQARKVITEFNDKHSDNLELGLDLNNQETQKLLSALNKTGQRLRLRAADYSRIHANSPELIYGRFVIHDRNVINNIYSATPPVIFTEDGSHPDAIMASLLELLTCPDGIAQLCLKERQIQHEFLVLTDILTAYSCNPEPVSGGRTTSAQKQERLKTTVEDKIHSVNRKKHSQYSNDPFRNSDIAASMIDEYRKLAIAVAPELSQRCMEISRYLHEPMDYVPQLAKLGEKIIDIFQKQATGAGEADTSFPHHDFHEELEYKLVRDRAVEDVSSSKQDQVASKVFSEAQGIAHQERLKGSYYPCPRVKHDDATGTKMDDWIKSHKLYQSLALAAGKNGRVSPLFLGFVDHLEADIIAAEHGSFRDHALSCAIFHTKNVHDLQMAILRDKGLMNDRLLPQILSPYHGGFDENLWPNLFDLACLSPYSNSHLGDQAILRPCLTLNAPNTTFGLLSSQSLSRSIALCADKAQPDTLGKLFHRLFYPGELTNTTEEEMRKVLRTVSRQINALEVSIISSNYKDLIKIGTHAAPLFTKRFAEEKRPYQHAHPALRAIEMYEKATSLESCGFVKDIYIHGLGREVYMPQVLENEDGTLLESADGTCFQLPGGHLINEDFTVLYKNHALKDASLC